ncbi:MAG TPA: hypothetical protein VHZ51_20300 [Ktedonobacteraceae bacterium]|jgi:hypothetical protein|nr:hypothetical protein [Ktedonobacteraceae bacterium]
MTQQQKPEQTPSLEQVQTPEPGINQGIAEGEGQAERYSHQDVHGVHSQYRDLLDIDIDLYDEQDRLSDEDEDEDDLSSDLDENDLRSTAGGEGLYDLEQCEYGLAEPLANPDEYSLRWPDARSSEGYSRNRYGTYVGADQHGYQHL